MRPSLQFSLYSQVLCYCWCDSHLSSFKNGSRVSSCPEQHSVPLFANQPIVNMVGPWLAKYFMKGFSLQWRGKTQGSSIIFNLQWAEIITWLKLELQPTKGSITRDRRRAIFSGGPEPWNKSDLVILLNFGLRK